MRTVLFLVILLFAAPVIAKDIRVRVVDENGAPISNVLTIVTSLEQPKEYGRFLTDRDGWTPNIQIDHGVFRVIATTPYGVWATTIAEFVEVSAPAEITLRVAPNVKGSVVSVGNSQVKLELGNGFSNAGGVPILVRDHLANAERWYRTDKGGVVIIDLVDEWTVALVVYEGKIITRRISACPVQLDQKARKPTQGGPCRTLRIDLGQGGL